MRNFGFSLALAAACLAAVPAQATVAKLVWGDLDLTSDAGKAELDRRIEAAAQQVCAPETVTGSRITNRQAKRDCMVEARDAMKAQVAAKNDHSHLAASNGKAPATADLRR